MNLSSQGLNFLGLTAKKFAPAGLSKTALNAVEQKFEEFEQTSTAFANLHAELNNLKAINCQAFCVVDGKKQAISEKSWDRGGILEGKVPLEEGIAKGLYHIEALAQKSQKADLDEELAKDLDELMEELKSKMELEADSEPEKELQDEKQSKDIFEPRKNFDKEKKKKPLEMQSSFKFIS